MKPIDQMNAKEMADCFDKVYTVSGAQLEDCADRLRAIHDLTRWIPVSERMPTEEDAINGYVLYWYNNPMRNESYPMWSSWRSGQYDPKTYPYWTCISTPYRKRITPPETK